MPVQLTTQKVKEKESYLHVNCHFYIHCILQTPLSAQEKDEQSCG